MASTSYIAEIELAEAAAPADGFIDHVRVEQYMVVGDPPTNLAASVAKERANMRYQSIVTNLQYVANIYITEQDSTGADANTPPDVFSFVMTVEHGDDSLVTADEENEGSFLTGDDCLKRLIARALIANSVADYQEYYNPTVSQSLGVNGVLTANAVRYGSTIGPLTVGRIANSLTTAEALITITLND